MLQSRLIKAARHWQQYRASMIHTLLSRTNTTAAELFYLRHLRSCAATPYGSNKTGHAGHGQLLGLSWLAFLGLEAAWKALLTTHVSQWHFSFRLSGKELEHKKWAAAISELLQSPRRGQQQARTRIVLLLNPLLLQSTSRLHRSDRRTRHQEAVAT